MEDRLKASILYVGGLAPRSLPPVPISLPEVSPINYVTHIRIPTLMLNGKYDMDAAYETRAKPMFDLLGTPEDQKELKLYETDHYVPWYDVIKESLAWLDRYLGPVK